ncbi:hypothetical protein KC939_02470 [Candidatus Saccharibacteria bacterium]|nr:hypothetical protein [Candidatus Saccharibacteria bacterium]
MDFTWLVPAVIAVGAFGIAAEKKTPFWGRALAGIVCVGFACTAVESLATPDAWVSWLGIILAVGIMLWWRRDRGSSSDEDDE